MDEEKNLPAQSYLTILSKVSNQISWLTFSLLIIIGTNTFLLYQNHFGALEAYTSREKENQKKVKQNANGMPSIEAINKASQHFDELDKKSSVITLPILGIPLINRDFLILYLIIGVVFLMWLVTLLNFTKGFLENLLNEYHYPSDSDANIIQSMFFLIMPTDYTSKKYGYYELIFHLFSLSIILLFVSDIWDICFGKGLYDLPVSENPSFSKMIPHLTAFYIVSILCLGASVLLYTYSKKILKHIRNTLILLRWNRTAFFPVLYEFAEERGNPLGERKNFVEYRICDDSNESKMFAILTYENKNKNENKNTIEIKADVNLPKSIRQFYIRHQKPKTEYDDQLKRTLTIEESFMRDYFRAILRDKLYEPELYSESLKIK